MRSTLTVYVLDGVHGYEDSSITDIIRHPKVTKLNASVLSEDRGVVFSTIFQKMGLPCQEVLEDFCVVYAFGSAEAKKLVDCDV